MPIEGQGKTLPHSIIQAPKSSRKEHASVRTIAFKGALLALASIHQNTKFPLRYHGQIPRKSLKVLEYTEHPGIGSIVGS